MFSRCCTFVLVTSAVLAASPAMAQTPTPDPARRYPLPTYDENWQFLSDPNRHSDPWDIVKYRQLADGMFASLGGEARESYERFGNQDFGYLVVEGTSQGRMSGKLWAGGKTPGGRFCNVFKFRDGRISSLHIYLDPDYTGEDEARFRWGKNRKW